MRKRLIALLVTSVLALAPTAALADPSFGPGGSDGEGNNAPHETPNQCHAPGQTSDLPQCR
jgi:hypothetical protein